MAATIGYGSSLLLGDGVSAALVAIPYLASITVPDAEAATVESTNLASANRTREFVAGLFDSGSFGFTSHYDAATYARLLAVKGVAKNWKIIWPDASNATFAAILTKTECEVGIDTIVDIKCDGKVTGAVTFSAS